MYLNPQEKFPQPVPRDRPVGRFAPSPTGELHLGNLRTAVLAWEHCRKLKGIFILRVEDLDVPRTIPGAEAQMLDDLRWLGLDWDEGPDVGGPAGPYRQSERLGLYAAALRQLEVQGRTFLCTCSRKDRREASAPHEEPEMSGEAPAYQGTCRNRDPEEQKYHPKGAAVRYNIESEPMVEFDEPDYGSRQFDLRRLGGDFIILRRDGLFAYQLACAVDDGLMGVTHVVRGADLLTSAPRQIALMRALGLPTPQYVHLPLVVDETGRRMCKRDGSCSLSRLRAQGYSPVEARKMMMEVPLL